MKTKLFSTLSLLMGFLGFAQIDVYFKYDDAGNQVYRGDGTFSKQQTKTEEIYQESETSETSIVDEKEFWNEIRIYPVPVKNTLTIDWTNKVDNLINDIGLYQQSSIHWIFQKKNVNTLNKTIQIDMSQQYMGVYILTFILKDGRRLSKNITKF